MAATLNEAVPNSLTAAKEVPKEIPNDGTGVINLDPWLEPFRGELKSRFAKAQDWIKKLDEYEGGLDGFSKVHLSSNCTSGSCMLTYFVGLREVRTQCPGEWRYHIPRMGTQCRRGVSHRRVQ